MTDGTTDFTPPSARADSALGSRWDRFATSRWYPFALAALAMLLASPSLRAGWIADDYIHRAKLLGSRRFDGLFGSRTDLFSFFDGDSQRTLQLMDIGLLPWWTDPHIRGAFWRPVTSATHVLDYALWPNSPALMHAQSLCWFGALIVAVTFVYRRLLDPRVAALAALLYAIDDARGMPVGFLANRNALIASFFGVLALLAHERWRGRGGLHNAAAGVVLLSLSLLSGEIGVSTLAYLVAYAAFIDRSPPPRRWAALLPYVGVVLVWRAAWAALGYGILGSDLYVDPLVQPFRFAGAMLVRAPALLLGQWFLPPSDITMALSEAQSTAYALIAAAILAVMGLLLCRRLRGDRRVAFGVSGMALSIPPVCAVFSSDRLLSFVGIGATALMAQFLSASRVAPLRASAKLLGGLMIVIHLVIAPLGLVFRSAFPAGPPAIFEQMLVRTPLDESVEGQDLIIVNAPSAFHAGFLPLMRDTEGLPVPRHTRVLAPGLPSVVIDRPSANSLEIRPAGGYLKWVFDRIFRSRDRALRIGDRVPLTGMVVEVVELTTDSRPAMVRVEFDVSLEHPSLRWLQWIGGEFVPFTPPAVGQTVELRPALPSLFAGSRR